MEIFKSACEEEILALPRVCSCSFPQRSLGDVFPQFYFEAPLKIWLLAQTVFKFCQNFTSFTDIVEK